MSTDTTRRLAGLAGVAFDGGYVRTGGVWSTLTGAGWLQVTDNGTHWGLLRSSGKGFHNGFFGPALAASFEKSTGALAEVALLWPGRVEIEPGILEDVPRAQPIKDPVKAQWVVDELERLVVEAHMHNFG